MLRGSSIKKGGTYAYEHRSIISSMVEGGREFKSP